jgi:hypothetical protein
MSFTGNENHTISLLDAADLTANYRSSHPGAVKGFFYGKTAISDIIAQDDCVGIRIYFGEDSLGNPQLVICGVLANEDDIDDGLLAELGRPCPPQCGSANALNS